MKIIAKCGTELEGVIRKFYEQMQYEKNQVIAMIEEFTGVKPTNFGYYWYFGITCVWAEDTWRFDEASNPKNVVELKMGGKTYYKPNKRLKVYKEFIKAWKNKFKGLDGKVLTKYGIPVMDDNSLIFVNWFPVREGNKYGIEVPSSLFDRMPKIKDKQYEISM